MSNLAVALSFAREHVALLEKEVATEARGSLEAEHRKLVPECRAAHNNVQELRAEANRLQRQFMTKQGVLDNARRLLNEWRESKPQPANYPMAASYDEWRIELAARQACASEAQRAYADATQEYQSARASWSAAKEAFDRLAERESELRSLLLPKRSSGITIEVQDGGEGMRLYRV